MLDRATFVRPIAHRGLHDAAAGLIENTGSAFLAAIAGGYGIECDLRPADGGLPVVFHDLTLERLTDAKGPVSRRSVSDLARVRYRGTDEPILTFADFLDLVGERAPLLVEIKSEWEPPDQRFLTEIVRLAQAYQGPLALMSFDPSLMAHIREMAPALPLGIVSGRYHNGDAEGWWSDLLSPERQDRLTHLLESGPVAPDFYAYHVAALPTPVTRYVREVLAMPVFAWTVRSEEDRRKAAAWADAPIFEGLKP